MHVCEVLFQPDLTRGSSHVCRFIVAIAGGVGLFLIIVVCIGLCICCCCCCCGMSSAGSESPPPYLPLEPPVSNIHVTNSSTVSVQSY